MRAQRLEQLAGDAALQRHVTADADGQPGGEAADQAFFQPFDLGRMAVGSQADLLLDLCGLKSWIFT